MGVTDLTPEDQERLTTSGLKAFFAIAKEWNLDEDAQADLLGLSDIASLRRWRTRPPKRLAGDHLERISHVLGIYKSLQLLLPTSDQAHGWVKKLNDAPLFGGVPALSMMRQGIPALFAVRSFLEDLVG